MKYDSRMLEMDKFKDLKKFEDNLIKEWGDE